MNLLSIIVPAYNVEKYVADTINSILNQPKFLWNCELVIVNDGSTDKSGDIINSFLNKCPSIKVIHQKNKGLSEARNTGLSLATGKYIWFVDSDDTITENAFEILNYLLNEENIEVFAFGVEYVSTDKRYIANTLSKKKYKYFYNTVQNGVILNKKISTGIVQRYIYLKKFLENHNLIFYPDIYHEDEEFNVKVLCYASRIFVSDRYIYHYFVNRPNSIMYSFKIKSLYDLMIIINELKKFREKQGLTEIQKSIIDDNILTIATSIVKIAFKNRSVSGVDIFLRENIKKLQNHARLVFDIHYLTLGKILKSLLLYICPKLLIYVMK